MVGLLGGCVHPASVPVSVELGVALESPAIELPSQCAGPPSIEALGRPWPTPETAQAVWRIPMDPEDPSTVVAVPVVTYPVHGASWEDIRTFINCTDVEAATYQRSGFSAHRSTRRGVCRLTDVVVSAVVVVALPNWLEAEAAPPEDREHWASWLARTQAHERGHVALAARMHRELAAALADAPCDAVDSRYDKLNADLRRLQADYDDCTCHGACQDRCEMAATLTGAGSP